MKTGLFLIILILSINSHGVEVNECTPYKTEILHNAAKKVPRIVSRLVNEIDYSIEQSQLDKHSIKKLIKAKYILKCASTRVKSFNIQCDNDDETYNMWTFPIIGNDLYIPKGVLDLLDENLAAAALIHEGTHKCGTADFGGTNEIGRFYHYLLPTYSTAPESSWYIEWHNIAATYDFWAIKGFCIPDHNCSELVIE